MANSNKTNKTNKAAQSNESNDSLVNLRNICTREKGNYHNLISILFI